MRQRIWIAVLSLTLSMGAFAQSSGQDITRRCCFINQSGKVPENCKSVLNNPGICESIFVEAQKTRMAIQKQRDREAVVRQGINIGGAISLVFLLGFLWKRKRKVSGEKKTSPAPKRPPPPSRGTKQNLGSYD